MNPHSIVWGSAQEQTQQHACRRHDTSYMDILCLQRPVSKTRHPSNPTRHRVGLGTGATSTTCVPEARHLTYRCSVPPARSHEPTV